MKQTSILIMTLVVTLLMTLLVTLSETRDMGKIDNAVFQKKQDTQKYYSPMAHYVEPHIRLRREENSSDLETAETVVFRPIFRHRQLVEEREKRWREAERRRQERRERRNRSL